MINLVPTRAYVAGQRQAAYLMAWPLAQQMEAYADAARGNPAKLNQMLADLDAIKVAYPYPET